MTRVRRWLSVGGRLQLLLVAVVTVAAATAGGYALASVQSRAAGAEAEAQLAKDNAVEIAEQVRAACHRRGEVARLLGDVCQQAEQVAATPAEPMVGPPGPPGPAGSPGPSGPPGRPPTATEVREAVNHVLTTMGVDIPPSMIAAEVAAYLVANPPEPGPPGPPPSPEQVGEAVTAWMRQNADQLRGPRGEQGEQGEPGPGPTPEEIGNAVAEWMVNNPLPACPEATEAQAVTLLTLHGPTDAVVCVVVEPMPS